MEGLINIFKILRDQKVIKANPWTLVGECYEKIRADSALGVGESSDVQRLFEQKLPADKTLQENPPCNMAENAASVTGAVRGVEVTTNPLILSPFPLPPPHSPKQPPHPPTSTWVF